MMLKPALRPPLRAPMRGATTLREGVGVWWQQRPIAFGAIGDSLIELQYATFGSFPAQVGTPLIWVGCAFAHWAAMVSGRRFWTDLYAVEGYSGKRTDEILTSMLAANATTTIGGSNGGTTTVARGVRAVRPRYAFEISGANDITQLVSAATIATNRAAIWSALRASGVEPVALSVPPRNSPATLQSEVAVVNAAVSAAAASAGVHFIDLTSAIDDGTGQWKTNMGRTDSPATGLHPSNEGAHAMATAIAADLNSWLPAWRKVPYVKTDLLATIEHTDGRSVDVPLLGTLGAGLFASSTGWGARFDQNHTTSIALDTAAPRELGSALRVTYPTPTTADGYSDRWGPAGGIATVTPGARVAFFGRIKFDAGHTGDQTFTGLEGTATAGAMMWGFKSSSLGSGTHVFTVAGANLSARDFYQELQIPPAIVAARFWNETRTKLTSTGASQGFAQIGLLSV